MPGIAVQIRPLRLRDVRRLHRLFLRALDSDFSYFPPGYVRQVKLQNSPTNLLRAWFDRRRLILVAVRGRQPVGFAFSAAHRDKIGHLYWLYVDPDLRGKRVGRDLLQLSLDGMQRRGMHSVELVTYNFDGYYKKHGFYHRGTSKLHDSQLHVMQYDLPGSNLPRKSTMAVKKRRHWRVSWPYWVALATALTGILIVHALYPQVAVFQVPPLAPQAPTAGSIVDVVSRQHYTPEQVTAQARQNYGPSYPQSSRGVTRIVITYRTQDPSGRLITDYASAYVPDNVTNAPVLAMAPGTTGLNAACAVTIENPAVHNWANYQSHMMAYAGVGYTGVITDYDNMRGAAAGTVQPYMVGVAEGRAVLDSIRALKRLPEAMSVSNFNAVFTAGYSQGGHSASWADAIRAQYAPDIKLAGVIGWGPVLNVETTWQGITSGSTLEWFGPYILDAYENYYHHTYPVQNILLPPWNQAFKIDAQNHCIDSDIAFWGTDPARIYTAQFLADLKTGYLPPQLYGDLQQDLAANQALDVTATPKLINQGGRDNVVLAAQQSAAVQPWCGAGNGSMYLHIYPDNTHYNLMAQSFNETLAWMLAVRQHKPLPNTCSQTLPQSTPSPLPSTTPTPADITPEASPL